VINTSGPIEFSDDGKTLTVHTKIEFVRLIAHTADETLQTVVRDEMVRIISEDAALQATVRKLALAQLLKLAEKPA
jgi:hypothetical protein